MPCSFCRNETHNISTCMSLAIQRAMSIYNDNTDYKPNHVDRHLEPNWWVTIHNNNMLHISPASKNVKALLTTFGKLRGTHHVFPEEELGYLMLENNFSRNPTGVIKFSINNNRMILEEITDNWEHILNEYTNAIIDIHLIQLERIERERENNNRTPPPHSRIVPLSLVQRERVAQREREREHRDEIQRRLYVSEQRRMRGSEEDIQHNERALEVENERQEQRRLHQQRQRQEQQRQHQERVDAMISCDKVIEATECPICMDDLKSTNRMILRCGHQFCGDCIFTHFQKQYGCKCPSCRGEYALRVSGWQPPNDITVSQQQQQLEIGDLETIRRILFATPSHLFDENIFASEHNEIEDEDDNLGF